MISKKSFLDGVLSEVTMDVLPMNLPARRINKILEKCTGIFRDNDDRATTEDILFIQIKNLDCKIIKLPEDVKAVQRLEMTSSGRNIVFGVDGRPVANRSYEDGSSLLSYISMGAYSQLISQLNPKYVPYDFSEYTHELVLQGTPDRNIFLEVARYIPQEDLFKIEDFEDYVAAKITKDYVKVNGFIGKKLINGREINFSSLNDSAKETISRLEKLWDEQRGDAILLLD